MIKKIGGLLLSGILITMFFLPALGGYFILQDTEPPVVREVNAIPNPQVQGGHVNITAAVIDNVQVNVVKAVITYPDSSVYNLTMEFFYDPSYYTIPLSFYNTTYNLLGVYNFYIWANDTSGNHNQSISYTFEVIEADVLPPVISGVQGTPNPQIKGGTVNVTCTVTDNVQVDSVHVIIRYPNYHVYNYTMTQVMATDNYYFRNSYFLLGNYHYYIWAKDTSGNSVHTSFSTFIITEEPGPSIHIEKKVKQDCLWVDSATVYVGDIIDFRLSIRNTGTVTLTDVRVADILPSFLRYAYNGYPSPSCESDHEIQWLLGCLNVGESRTITFSAVVIEPGCGYNEAHVCSPVGTEDSDAVTITSQNPCEGIIVIDKKVHDGCGWVDNITARVGDTLDFKITVENSGSAILTMVHLTDTLPLFLRYAYNGYPSPSCESDHEIQWFLGCLDVGESRTITFSAVVIEPGYGYNEAFAFSEEGVNNTDSVLLECIMDGDDTTPPQISIGKPARYLYIADRAILPTLWRPIILGGITLEAIVMDDESGIDRVEFVIGNDLKNIDTDWPYEWFWNENSFGFYNIKVRAYDTAGNSNIESIDVYVINF